jgi:hypothetical protein
MAAVAERIEVEAPAEQPADLRAQLADIRATIGKRTEAIGEQQAIVSRSDALDRQYQDKLTEQLRAETDVVALHETAASSGQRNDKILTAAESACEAIRKDAARLGLQARGAEAAKAKAEARIAEVNAQIEALRTEEGRIKVRLLEADALREVAALDVEIRDAVCRVYAPRATRVREARRLAARFGGDLSAREPNTVVAVPTVGVHQWSATPGASVSKQDYIEVNLSGEIELGAPEAAAQLVGELGL